MTSSVKVAAHCATDKVVLALVFDNMTGICTERHEIEDGKEIEITIYDNKAVTTMEILKADLVMVAPPEAIGKEFSGSDEPSRMDHGASTED